MNKLVIALIIVVAVGIAAAFILPNSNSSGSDDSGNSGASDSSGNNAINDGNEASDVRTFVLTGENFKFVMNGVNNPDIVVNKGDKVRIEFSSTQGFHDWVVDEFNAATQQVRDTDEATFVEFTADKAGTFEYYCSVGEHRANGMKGNLIVN